MKLKHEFGLSYNKYSYIYAKPQKGQGKKGLKLTKSASKHQSMKGARPSKLLAPLSRILAFPGSNSYETQASTRIT